MEQHMSLSGAIPGLGARFGLSTKRIHYRSQLVAYPYFLVSAVLFFLQIIFGLLTAAYYIWPTYWDQASQLLDWGFAQDRSVSIGSL